MNSFYEKHKHDVVREGGKIWIVSGIAKFQATRLEVTSATEAAQAEDEESYLGSKGFGRYVLNKLE